MGVANAAVFKMVPKFVPTQSAALPASSADWAHSAALSFRLFLGAVVDALGTRGYAGGFFAYVVLAVDGDQGFYVLLVPGPAISRAGRSACDSPGA